MCPPRRSRGYGRRPLSQCTVLTAPSLERDRSDRTQEMLAEAVDVGFCLPSVSPGIVALSAFGRLRIAPGVPPAGEAEGTQRRARCLQLGARVPGAAPSARGL